MEGFVDGGSCRRFTAEFEKVCSTPEILQWAFCCYSCLCTGGVVLLLLAGLVLVSLLVVEIVVVFCFCACLYERPCIHALTCMSGRVPSEPRLHQLL